MQLARPSSAVRAVAVVVTVLVIAAGSLLAYAGTRGVGARARSTATAAAAAGAKSTQAVADRPGAANKGQPGTAKPARRPAGRTVGSLYRLPAPAVDPGPCTPLPPATGGPRPAAPRPAVPESRVPRPLPVTGGRADLAAVRGKGMWLTTWSTTRVNADHVVTRARAAGLTQVWVRTGGSNQGWYGDRVLPALLPAAHRAHIEVIAWDFPTLSDPGADARRARTTLAYRVGNDRLDGFSPDIETPGEGTFWTSRRVAAYLSQVRQAAGSRPVVATVMRPTNYLLRHYPYATIARYADVLAPMDYWACQEPGLVTQHSIERLARFHRPVAVIGQAYDMASEGGPRGVPSAAATWRFLDVAKRSGAIGASLWTYEQSGAGQWEPLQRYHW